MKNFVVVGVLVGVLAGCSSTSNKVVNMIEIPQAKQNQIPDWFLTKQSDNKSIFVTATDVSRDMQFAIDKATLNAKVQLAERLSTKVESLVRESALESGYGVKDVEREIDRVSKVTVNQKLSYFTREHVAVVLEEGYYRAFVMLKLTEQEGRRLTVKDKSNEREEKFKELDNLNTTVNEVPIDPARILIR